MSEKFKVVSRIETENGFEIKLTHQAPTQNPTPGVAAQFGGSISMASLSAERADAFPVGKIFELVESI